MYIAIVFFTRHRQSSLQIKAAGPNTQELLRNLEDMISKINNIGASNDDVDTKIEYLVNIFHEGTSGLYLVGNSLLHYANMVGGCAVWRAYKLLVDLDEYQHELHRVPNKYKIKKALGKAFELDSRQIQRNMNKGIMYTQCPPLLMVQISPTELENNMSNIMNWRNGSNDTEWYDLLAGQRPEIRIAPITIPSGLVENDEQTLFSSDDEKDEEDEEDDEDDEDNNYQAYGNYRDDNDDDDDDDGGADGGRTAEDMLGGEEDGEQEGGEGGEEEGGGENQSESGLSDDLGGINMKLQLRNQMLKDIHTSRNTYPLPDGFPSYKIGSDGKPDKRTKEYKKWRKHFTDDQIATEWDDIYNQFRKPTKQDLSVFDKKDKSSKLISPSKVAPSTTTTPLSSYERWQKCIKGDESMTNHVDATNLRATMNGELPPAVKDVMEYIKSMEFFEPVDRWKTALRRQDGDMSVYIDAPNLLCSLKGDIPQAVKNIFV